MSALPVLYSFRRCPYAIRARMALAYSGISVELREVSLKDKPQAMLDASGKGTVPVLVLPGGEVIDESIEILHWALALNDPQGWLDNSDVSTLNTLIQKNDGPFKRWLDQYKYADRHPEYPASFYRERASVFLQQLEERLEGRTWISGPRYGYADLAILPFIRQFASVDRPWFDESVYQEVRQWLDRQLQSPLFLSVMKKYPGWTPQQQPVIFETRIEQLPVAGDR